MRKLFALKFFAAATVLLAAALACVAWRRPSVYRTFDSPDGRWRLTLTDVDPALFQSTTVYSIADRTSPIPLSGTRAVTYDDSNRPAVTVTWGPTPGRVRVSNFAFELSAEFDRGRQLWKVSEPPAATTAPAPATAMTSAGRHATDG